MTILYIAVGVCAVVFVAWVILTLIDGRRLRGMRTKRPIGYPTTARDREEYARMQKLRDEHGPIFNEEGYSNEDDDDTKTWPIMPGNEP